MALRIVLDANRYSDLQRGVDDAVEIIDAADEIRIPFCVLAELRAGFRYGNRAAENEQYLSRFLELDHVSVLYPDNGTCHMYADIYGELRRAGTPIPQNDLWVAALTIQHGLVLFSRDSHFQRVKRLPRL